MDTCTASNDIELTPATANGTQEKYDTSSSAANSKSPRHEVLCEWHLLIEVIDRFLFIFFLVVMIVALLTLVILIPMINNMTEDAYIESLRQKGATDENYSIFIN